MFMKNLKIITIQWLSFQSYLEVSNLVLVEVIISP